MWDFTGQEPEICVTALLNAKSPKKNLKCSEPTDIIINEHQKMTQKMQD